MPATVDGRPARLARAAVVLASLALSAAGIASVAGRGAVPTHVAGVGPTPTAVAGRATATWAQAVFEAQRHDAGAAVELRGVGTVTLGREVGALELALLAVSALTYAILAGVLAVPRVGDAAATRVGGCLLLGGLAVSLVGVYPPRSAADPALSLAYVVVLAALPVAFVDLATTFPRRHRFRDRAPLAFPAFALVGAACAASGVAAWHGYFRAPSPAAFEATRGPTVAGLTFLVAGLATGCVALAVASRDARSVRERSQARWILWGIAVAAAPFVLLRALPRLVAGVEAPLPPAFDRAVELAAPAGFAAAVARHRFLDIDVVIRRSVLYTVVAGALALVAAAFVLGASALLAGGTRPPGLAWTAAGLAAGALFVPVRRGVSAAVDRAFFRIRSARRDALIDLGHAVREAPTEPAVADVLARTVADALDAAWCAVVVARGDELVVAGPVDAATARRAHLEVVRAGPALAGPVARPGATAVREIEGAGVPEALPDARVSVPVARDSRVLASVHVGPRRGGRHFVAEDVELLSGAALHAADALERLRLAREGAEASMARRALADLDRRRTDFLLRVAHDLRSPLAAVRWSVDNVLDGLSGPLTDRQATDLAGARAALRQLGALVENVLAVSRMAVGADLEVGPVDAVAAVRDAVEALAPLARVRGVRVVVSADEVPVVRARRDGLLQVAQNLVDNALKHAPEGSDVDVRIARGERGEVRVSVRDHGPGIPADARPTLFERFRAPVDGPRSSTGGLGIGLHVVKSWVDAFGGCVEAGAPEGGGAQLCVRLRAWEGTG